MGAYFIDVLSKVFLKLAQQEIWIFPFDQLH